MKAEILSRARRFKAAIKQRVFRKTEPQPFVMKFPACVRIQSPHNTLEVCKRLIDTEIRGAYLRFGDGDVFLLNHKNDSYQAASKMLAVEMREAFDLHGPGIMKCLMLHSRKFGLWSGMAPGIHEVDDMFAASLLTSCYEYFIGTPIYSPVALPYVAVYDQPIAIDFLRFLKTHSVCFIGNRNVPDSVLKNLFGNVVKIPTPANNSYAEIDRIEQDTGRFLESRNGDFGLCVVSMGCSGRVLMKRIYNRGYNVFLFDFGSLLDAFCGWDTRTWIKIVPKNVQALLDEL